MNSGPKVSQEGESLCSNGENDHDYEMGSMVQFHHKMVKDAEDQKPLVAIVARLLARLVENNDKEMLMIIT